MSEVFAEYSTYYDLLYADKDYHAEARYVASKLRQHQPGGRRVLEFGCGTGRHASLLARDGFEVLGIERSQAMLDQGAAIAADEAPLTPGSFTAVAGDIRTRHLPGSSFDAAVALFHVVSYQTENEDVLALFRNAARHLGEQGLFLFDVWYAPAVLTLRPETRVKRAADERLRVTRIAEPRLFPQRNCVEVHYEVFVEAVAGATKRLEERHLMRYFTTPEIAWLAGASGFHVIEAEEWLTGKPPSTATWGVCYVLKKSSPEKCHVLSI